MSICNIYLNIDSSFLAHTTMSDNHDFTTKIGSDEPIIDESNSTQLGTFENKFNQQI